MYRPPIGKICIAKGPVLNQLVIWIFSCTHQALRNREGWVEMRKKLENQNNPVMTTIGGY